MKVMLMILVTSMTLAGCAVAPVDCPAPLPAKIIDTGCQWARPIQVGPDDSIITKRAALAAWSAYRKNCPTAP